MGQYIMLNFRNFKGQIFGRIGYESPSEDQRIGQSH